MSKSTVFPDGTVRADGIDEPEKNVFFRLSIIAYELGEVHRAVVYMKRFLKDTKIQKIQRANLKLALADTFTQLSILCKEQGLDEEEIRELGWEHLGHRFKDFKKDGWKAVK